MRQFKISEKFTPRLTRASSDYLNDVESYSMMSPEKEAEVAFLAASGDQKAKNQLVEANLRFVLSVAKMYSNNPEDYADLVASGNIGLVEAADKFDPTRGFKFISFAVWHIRKEMLAHIGESKKLVRLPMNQVNVLRAMRNASNEISMTEGREATFDETFIAIKEKNVKYKSLRKDALFSATLADYRPTSFSNPVSSDNDSLTLLDIIKSDSEEADFDASQKDFRRLVMELSENLLPTERDIIYRRHGLFEYADEPQGFGDIGRAYGQTGENLRVRYMRIMKKLRREAIRLSIKEHDIF